MNCFICEKATQVISSYGSFIECSAIKCMDIKRNLEAHAAHQIMLYNGQLFIPKCCSNDAVKEKNGDYYPPKKKKLIIKSIGHQLPKTPSDENQGVFYYCCA